MPRDWIAEQTQQTSKPRDWIAEQTQEPKSQGLLNRIAQNPVVNFLAGAESGAAGTIGRPIRSLLRDIPTQTTRGLAQDIAQRQAATSKAYVTPGISGTAGKIAGSIAPLVAAAPFAPEDLAARLLTSTVAGASQTPRHQVEGGIAGLAGAGLSEVLPALFAVGKKAVQGIASSSLVKPIRDEMKDLFTSLRKGVDPGTINEVVFSRMKQLYQEVKGSKIVGNSEVPLKKDEYINRDPSQSVRNLFAHAARLGDKNIDRFKKDSWNIELTNQSRLNNKDLVRSPTNENALEVKGELRNLKSTRLKNFNDATKLRQDLNHLTIKGYSLPGISSGNPKLTRIVSPLKNAVDKSMTDSASIHPETLDALNTANNAFKNELIPYQKVGKRSSPFIKRLSGEIPSSDKLIESYVKKGEPENLKTFLGQLPDQDTRDLVTAHVFKAHEKNPRAFITAYSKLDPPEKNLLFPKHQSRLDKLETLFKRHPDAFSTVLDEPSGIKDNLAKGIGFGLSGFGLERLVSGQPLEALALASPVIARQGIKAISKIPSVREKLFQSLIKESTKGAKKTRLLNSLVTGGLGGQLVNQLTGGQ